MACIQNTTRDQWHSYGKKYVPFVGLPKSFRYQKTEYEPSLATHQQNGLSQGIQYLQLPLLQLQNGDSNIYYAYLTGMYIKLLCKPYCSLLIIKTVTIPQR